MAMENVDGMDNAFAMQASKVLIVLKLLRCLLTIIAKHSITTVLNGFTSNFLKDFNKVSPMNGSLAHNLRWMSLFPMV